MRPCRSRGIGDAGERRQLAERQVHFGDGARHPVVAKALQEARVELDRIDERQERAAWIGIRDHRRRGNLGSVLQQHALCAAVRHGDARDGRVEANRRRRPRAPRRPWRASTRPARPSRRSLLPPGTGSVAAFIRSSGTGATGPRTSSGAEDAARGDDGLQQIGPVNHSAHQIGDRHRHPPQQPEGVGPPELAELPSGLQQLPDFLTPGLIERRRASARAGAEETRRAAPAWRRNPDSAPRRRPNAHESLRRSARRRSTTPADARPATARPAADRDAGTPRGAASCMSASDRRAQRSGRMREGRAPRAGRDLLGHRRTAHHRTPLRAREACSPPARDRTRRSEPLCPAPMMMMLCTCQEVGGRRQET